LIELNERNQTQRQNNIKTLNMLRFFLIKSPPVFTLDLKLGNLCNPADPDDFLYSDLNEFMGKNMLTNMLFLGTRYSDEAYFFLSRGLLNPLILELIPNGQALQTPMLTPSSLMAEAWQKQEYKQFQISILGNLFEQSEDEHKQLSALTNDKNILSHLKQYYGFTDKQWTSDKYHYLWNISQNEVQNELDRVMADRVSFLFVLDWIQYRGKKSELRSFIDSKE